MGRYAWDMGVDYSAARLSLIDGLNRARSTTGTFGAKRVASHAILLTQLKNGSRISEARDAVDSWAKDGSREHQVRARKEGSIKRCDECGRTYSKRARVNTVERHFSQTGHAPKFTELPSAETRTMVVPGEVEDADRLAIEKALGGGVSVKSLVNFSRRHLGFNTHSLRYANTTHQGLPRDQGGLGREPQVIAKIQHRKNLNLVVDYFSQKVADALLREDTRVAVAPPQHPRRTTGDDSS
jgi:hypothetical protein